MSTNAAQATSAFITESKTILTTSPGPPEKAAIPRAIPLGLKTGGTAAVGAVAVLTWGREGRAGVRRGRPPV